MGVYYGEGVVSSQPVLITQPQAVQQARGVGGARGEGGEAGEQQIRVSSNPCSSFSSSSSLLCIRRGFDKKFCFRQCRTTELFLPRRSLVSYIPAGDRKLVNLFLRCILLFLGMLLPMGMLLPLGIKCLQIGQSAS